VIDVLLPSRSRLEMLRSSAESLWSLADNPGDVTVHVAADHDDQPTIALATELGANCVVFDPRRGYDQMHVYYQRLAAQSSGGWLLVWNDDAQMLTPLWDTILAGQPAGVLIADLQSRHTPLCCFPAVRRGAVDALGRFSTDNPHVDTFWQDVGYGSATIMTVPIRVHHDQPPGGGSSGNQHDFYGPAHQAELAACAGIIREYASSLSG
jgi:hypothetical protein